MLPSVPVAVPFAAVHSHEWTYLVGYTLVVAAALFLLTRAVTRLRRRSTRPGPVAVLALVCGGILVSCGVFLWAAVLYAVTFARFRDPGGPELALVLGSPVVLLGASLFSAGAAERRA